jgi:methyl-accepting chemotaxis protein
MSDNNELDDFSELEELQDSYIDDVVEDEELDEYWNDVAEQTKAMQKSAIILVNELTGIRMALSDRQQLTDSFGQLNSNAAKQQQQIQTIASLLEQLTKSLSTDNLSRLIQIQKSFSTFAQKLEMFEQGINASIRCQQESQKQADEIYQNLNRSWRRLEDEVKIQRQIIGGIFSWENFAVLSIGTGFSAAAFMLLGFKLFITK